jgi:hypothetical protein
MKMKRCKILALFFFLEQPQGALANSLIRKENDPVYEGKSDRKPYKFKYLRANYIQSLKHHNKIEQPVNNKVP